jgi:hypothetical protein
MGDSFQSPEHKQSGAKRRDCSHDIGGGQLNRQEFRTCPCNIASSFERGIKPVSVVGAEVSESPEVLHESVV